MLTREGVIFRLAERLEGAQARRSHLLRRLQGLLAMAAGRREFVRSNLQGCTKPSNGLCCVYGGAQVTSCQGRSTREARVVDQNQPSRPKAPIDHLVVGCGWGHQSLRPSLVRAWHPIRLLIIDVVGKINQ